MWILYKNDYDELYDEGGEQFIGLFNDEGLKEKVHQIAEEQRQNDIASFEVQKKFAEQNLKSAKAYLKDKTEKKALYIKEQNKAVEEVVANFGDKSKEAHKARKAMNKEIERFNRSISGWEHEVTVRLKGVEELVYKPKTEFELIQDTCYYATPVEVNKEHTTTYKEDMEALYKLLNS